MGTGKEKRREGAELEERGEQRRGAGAEHGNRSEGRRRNRSYF